MSTSELSRLALRGAVILAAATVSFCVTLLLARISPVHPARLGSRGRKRAAARSAMPISLLIEPVLGVTAGLLRVLPMNTARAHCEGLIRRTGDVAGLCGDELLALSLWAMAAGFGFGFWFVHTLGLDPFWLLITTLLGAILPLARLHGLARDRAKALERSLPSAMDLCVLCMGAGTDFPSAVAFATQEMGVGHEVCREELSILLEQLSLGRTRVEALEDLSARSGSQTVQQFVAAVCQSETKGTPLVDALSIQSSTLRQRRSVIAEELAAKAAVRMMLPLMLMVASVLLVIFGPFIVNGIGL